MIDALYREHGARIRARLIRLTRDFDLAEDALQDAFADAAESWARDGAPEEPVGWLVRAARNKAVDRIRRRELERRTLPELIVPGEERAASHELDRDERAWGWGDDTLRLLFTCCHPALPLEGQVALTLRTVAGLTTEEIARAFLVTEATMAQRLVRAKAKITGAGIAYRVPEPDELPERLEALLRVVYLVFTEGYAATHGESLLRVDLCAEAIRVARLVVALLPDAHEALGLLALLLLTHARAAARVDAEGDLVLLEDQDRARWDRAAIDEGLAILDRLAVVRARDPYTLQAAIAGLHASTPDAEATDWRGIALLYERLLAATPTPIVALNRAVAIGMRDGPEAGLQALVSLEGDLADYALFYSARADFARRRGDLERARADYQAALARTTNAAEARFLRRRIASLGG